MITSDEDEQLWVWEYQTEDGSSHDLFMDINEPIRFRVIDEEFIDLTPTGPTNAANVESAEPTEQKKAPYSILVSLFVIVSKKSKGVLSGFCTLVKDILRPA